MKKKIKLKRRRSLKYLKIILLMILVSISFVFIYNYLNKIQIFSSNEEFIRVLLNKSNNNLKYNKKNILNRVSSFISNININKPITLLENSLYYSYSDDTELVYNDDYNPEEMDSNHIKDPNPKYINKPQVYIYNSHQLENYSSVNYEAYNITPNVMMASYLLREKLNDLGINTIVEESDITEFIRINNWNYNYSYVASRYYIEDAMKKNPSLKFFIDLHRDALTKDRSTTSIDGKNYAKVLFVVGMEHSNYQKNLDIANNLNQKIYSKYPTLTRGAITKAGENVDGIYNQDLHPNMILLELGGNENTIDEVLNTIEIISIILKEHISNG